MSLFKPDILKMQHKGDVEGLIKALGSKDANVRSDACRALKMIKDSRALEPLLLLLKDPDENVRKGAIYTLAEFKDERALQMRCWQFCRIRPCFLPRRVRWQI